MEAVQNEGFVMLTVTSNKHAALCEANKFCKIVSGGRYSVAKQIRLYLRGKVC